uniref:RxLR effector candidate protein n=1 Tax=Hyaloperonospora arabidopsidis (strain Emoy2) TaxID=559515 RepID=M4BNI1_HYAAE
MTKTARRALFVVISSLQFDTVKMADPAAGTPPSDKGAAIVSAQLTALLLKDEDDTDFTESSTPSTSPSVVRSFSQKEENKSPPNHRPLLFNSMREALASSGRLKEEPGGYVIKHHSGCSKQQQSRNVERPKHRHTKQRSHSKSDAGFNNSSTVNAGEDEADAAGYTVTRRRSSCDHSQSNPAAPKRSNQRPSLQARGKKKPPQQQQPARPRRGSMSTLSQSHLLASPTPLPSSSVPPGFQPHSVSRVLQPPPGLTPAASGWVVKAAASAGNANKIEEPPVEALWPEMKTTTTTDSGWAVAATPSSSLGSSLRTQTWSSGTGSAVVDHNDDDVSGVYVITTMLRDEPTIILRCDWFSRRQVWIV